MSKCKYCLKQDVCNRDVGHGYSVCPHYMSADVVPKSKYDLAVKEREANVKGFAEQIERLNIENQALRSAANSYKMHYKNLAEEIFKEINSIFQKYYDECSENSDLKLLEPLRQAERFIINEIWHDVSELEKKYH